MYQSSQTTYKAIGSKIVLCRFLQPIQNMPFTVQCNIASNYIQPSKNCIYQLLMGGKLECLWRLWDCRFAVFVMVSGEEGGLSSPQHRGTCCPPTMAFFSPPMHENLGMRKLKSGKSAGNTALLQPKHHVGEQYIFCLHMHPRSTTSYMRTSVDTLHYTWCLLV